MFLKSTAFVAATLLGAKSALASFIEDDDKSLEAALAEGTLPEGKLSLFNTSNREMLKVTYRDSFGQYSQEGLDSLNWILRCHNTDETTQMDLRVIEYLNRLDNCFGGNNEIHIISGYRSPAYNEMLRSKSKGVAKDSFHTKGMAMDIFIPGVPLHKVRETALALAAGGVGYYPKSNFVHIDSGHYRFW